MIMLMILIMVTMVMMLINHGDYSGSADIDDDGYIGDDGDGVDVDGDGVDFDDGPGSGERSQRTSCHANTNKPAFSRPTP